jgi:hypothetical protein
MQEAEDLANQAVKAGVQHDLDIANEYAKKRATWKPNATEVLAKWSTFCKKCASQGLSKELQDQLTRDRTRYQKIVPEIVDLNQEMDNAVKRIQARTITVVKPPPPVDIPKLKHALGLDGLPLDNDLKNVLKLKGPARANAMNLMEKKYKFQFTDKNRANLMNAKQQQ